MYIYEIRLDSKVIKELTLLHGEFTIRGLMTKQPRQLLLDINPSQTTQLLRRLQEHGLFKKVGKRYTYSHTEFGRQVATMALKMREMTIIFQLAIGCSQATYLLAACKRMSFLRYQFSVFFH